MYRHHYFLTYFNCLLTLLCVTLTSCREELEHDDIQESYKPLSFILESRANDDSEFKTGDTFRAIAYYKSNNEYFRTGTYCLIDEDDTVVTPVQITYDTDLNTITSVVENRDSALHSYGKNLDIYFVSPGYEYKDGFLCVNHQYPFYSTKFSIDQLMYYAPIKISSAYKLKSKRSRIIVDFYKSNDLAEDSQIDIRNVEMHNAGTNNKTCLYLPSNLVMADENNVRNIEMQSVKTSETIRYNDGIDYTSFLSTGYEYVVSADYYQADIIGLHYSDYIQLNFDITQNGASLSQSILLTTPDFYSLEPGYDYKYNVFISSEILRLTLTISEWNEIEPSTSTINDDFIGTYDFGSWNISDWQNGTSGDSGNATIRNNKQ